MSDKYRKQTLNTSVILSRRDAIKNKKEVRMRSKSTYLDDTHGY